MLGLPDADPSINDLARELAALEERMNTHKAQNETSIERLEKNLANRDVKLILAVFAIVALATAILGVLIGLPAATS